MYIYIYIIVIMIEERLFAESAPLPSWEEPVL